MSKKTNRVTKNSRLMLYRATTDDYCDNHAKHINNLCRLHAEITKLAVSMTYIAFCFKELKDMTS